MFSVPICYALGILIAAKMYLDDSELQVIPAVAAYSQNAYVCFFRSEEYRRLLTEQISMYFPCFKNAFPIKSAERSISMKRTTVVVKI
ncbi:hypothetical protein B9Z55_013374 [Caenorhabditis nigoni]|uniref:Uncharacterized protein n=1 Tax=Caenorhabditis nigoni TaxID=1611254 RepID=A0A2G5U1X8_9PELO|nr:hypothetical protein B9Z55_013374 [Caenorhabditis nigoni]